MPRKILLVDDNKINLEILREMLTDDYDVLLADNGQEAIDQLKQDYHSIAAVLLDIMMPVMDGFEVLQTMRSDRLLEQIPVIIITGDSNLESEKKALSLGANDFVQKPFDAEILKRRLENLINLREASITANMVQRDLLTGLWNREGFFERAGAKISRKPNDSYILACLDVDNFKIINDQFGTENGDEVLKSIAAVLRRDCEADGSLCGRISADNFVVLYEASILERHSEAHSNHQIAEFDQLRFPVTISIGRYLVSDKNLPVSTMYDRAKIAQKTIKGRSDTHIAMYDESMRKRILREQEIVNSMNGALETGQFEAWFQPQYNHHTGAIIGAEALVRWRHPEDGLISPGIFIPIFEKNGFVYELDKYVWEQVCAHLRRWQDEGRESLPVSVNISRTDLFHDDLVSVICGLVAKYHLPPDLLRLEITESAFALNSERIVTVVKELISWGFTVEIDDFGSGYSSLNTLKDVPAQILKLDLRFFQNSEDSQRGGSIVESVVRMAKWIGMTVIAEGVELKTQADYLKSVGCYNIQGFYYARPMPVEEFEALLDKSIKTPKLSGLKTLVTLDNNEFWNPKSIETLIFNSYVGGAYIFEYKNGQTEIIRMNDQFALELNGLLPECGLLRDSNLFNFMDEENAAILTNAIQTSIETNHEASCELMLSQGSQTEYLRHTIRVIARTDDMYLCYAVIHNLTAQRVAEQEKEHTASQLEAVMTNVDSGITATKIQNGNFQIIFSNERFYSLLGFTNEQYEKRYQKILDNTVEEDRPLVIGCHESVKHSGNPTSLEFRVVWSDGKLHWMRSYISNMQYPDIDEPVQLAVTNDITEQDKTQRELLDNLPCGAGVYELKDGQMNLLYQNKSYWEMVGLNDAAYPDPSSMSAIHPDDTPILMQDLMGAIQQHRDVACDIRLRHLTRGYMPVHLAGRILPEDNGGLLIYVTFTPISV